MDKQQLRKDITLRRDALPLEIREIYSAKIMQQLLNLQVFQMAQTVSCFVSFRSEINTIPIIEYMLKIGKRVVLPVTDLSNQCLIFSELRDFHGELVKSTYGILEPKKEFIRPVDNTEIEFVLAPGLVFDLLGYRIGYGGGYYDRFLGNFVQKPFTVALAFEVQISSKQLPAEKFDIPVDLILTEERLIDCREQRKNLENV